MSSNKIVLPIILHHETQNQIFNLELSAENYQQQFIQFLRTYNLTQRDAKILKHRIENQIERMVLIAKCNSKKQNIQNQYSQAKHERHSKYQKQQFIQKIQNKTMYEHEQGQFINQKDKQQIRNDGHFEQKRVNHSDQKYSAQQNENIQNSDKVTVKKKLCFPLDIQSIKKTNQHVNNSGQVTFRVARDIKENYMISNQKQQQQSQHGKIKNIDTDAIEEPRRFIFLQDYKKNINVYEKQRAQKRHKQEYQIYNTIGRSPKNKKIDEISQRLYEAHTQNFSSKKFGDRNFKQEQLYNQMIQYNLRKSLHKEDKYKKFPSNFCHTTVSFRQKFQPEPQYDSLEISSQDQNTIRKRKKKIERVQANLKGRHCEAKQIKENMILEQKRRKQKQHQIRKNKKQRQNNIENSVSPASKSRKSRQCAFCEVSKGHKNTSFSPNRSPKIKQRPDKKQKAIKQPKVNSKNKKFVSSILNQAYQQFQKQIKIYKQ